jgi:hypothetical protein
VQKQEDLEGKLPPPPFLFFVCVFFMQRGQELSFSSLILFLPTETMTSWVRHPSLLMVFSYEMCVLIIFFFYSSTMKMMMTTLLLSSSYGLLL